VKDERGPGLDFVTRFIMFVWPTASQRYRGSTLGSGQIPSSEPSPWTARQIRILFTLSDYL